MDYWVFWSCKSFWILFCKERWIKEAQESEQWLQSGYHLLSRIFWDASNFSSESRHFRDLHPEQQYKPGQVFAKAMTATAALLKQCQVRNDAHVNPGTATGTRHKYDFYFFSQVKISYSQKERNLILSIKSTQNKPKQTPNLESLRILFMILWDSHSSMHQMGRSLFSMAQEKQGKLLNGSGL